MLDMLEVIRDAITETDPHGGTKNIIIWSSNHDYAKDYYRSNIEHQLGYKWVGPLDVTLHNIPVWDQFATFCEESPWCLSLTPKELILGNYEYGVSEQVKKSHKELIEYWIYTQQIIAIQNDGTNILNPKHMINHEQW